MAAGQTLKHFCKNQASTTLCPPVHTAQEGYQKSNFEFCFFSSKWSFEYIKRLWLNKSWFMYPKPVKNEDWSDPSLVLERLELPILQ